MTILRNKLTDLIDSRIIELSAAPRTVSQQDTQSTNAAPRGVVVNIIETMDGRYAMVQLETGGDPVRGYFSSATIQRGDRVTLIGGRICK